MTCTKAQWATDDEQVLSPVSDAFGYDARSVYELLRDREKESTDVQPPHLMRHNDMVHSRGRNGEPDVSDVFGIVLGPQYGMDPVGLSRR
jgi:hypothetical protein